MEFEREFRVGAPPNEKSLRETLERLHAWPGFRVHHFHHRCTRHGSWSALRWDRRRHAGRLSSVIIISSGGKPRAFGNGSTSVRKRAASSATGAQTGEAVSLW